MEYYTSYSFEKENEDEGFNFIKNLIDTNTSEYLSYKIKYNAHDFGTYKSIEIYYDDEDEYINDDGDFTPGLDEAHKIEKEIQKNLSHIL